MPSPSSSPAPMLGAERAVVTGTPDVAGSMRSFNETFRSTVGDIFGGIQSAAGHLSEGARTFSRGFESTVQPILDSVYDIGKTVEQVGYIGMAFDPKGRFATPRVIGAGQDLQQRAMDSALSVAQKAQAFEARLDAAEGFDPEARGRANFDAYRNREEARREEKRKRKKKRQSSSSRQNDPKRQGKIRYSVDDD